MRVSTASDTLTVALVGNPNCGKTTLFNALTGLRQKVGNYPGVTVEKKEGRAPLPGGVTGPPARPARPLLPDAPFARRSDRPRSADGPARRHAPPRRDPQRRGRLQPRTQSVHHQPTARHRPARRDRSHHDRHAGKRGHGSSCRRAGKEFGVPVCAVVASRKQGLDESARRAARRGATAHARTRLARSRRDRQRDQGPASRPWSANTTSHPAPRSPRPCPC